MKKQLDVSKHRICLKMLICLLMLCSRHGCTQLINVASDGTRSNTCDGAMSSPISADRRYIAFSSYASNIVPNDNNELLDIFTYDKENQALELVSFSSEGVQGNADSDRQSIVIMVFCCLSINFL